MSQLVKAALIILTLNVFLYVAFPQAQLGADVVHKLISGQSDNLVQPGVNLNKTLSNTTKGETGIIAGTISMPDYVQKAMGLFVIIAGIFTSPFSVANYLIGLGAPVGALLIYVVVVAGVYILALLDWIRSGG